MTRVPIVVGVLLGWVVLAPVANAGARDGQEDQPSRTAEALQKLQARPRVSLSVARGNRSAAGALDAYVELTNLSENDLSIQRIELDLPGELSAARRAQPGPIQAGYLMHPGEQRFHLFKLPPQDVGWFRPLGNASLLTFVPGEYQLRAIVTFKVPPSNETTVTETTVVTLQPPLVSLIWGGIVGSLLLAAFVGTYRLVREPRDKRVRLLVQILFLAGAGAVCAVIALILLRRLQGVELPVNVTVADFYGGVVIGLFSFKIGDWLYVRLFGEGQQKPDSAG